MRASSMPGNLFNALAEASVVQAVGDNHIDARKVPQPADQIEIGRPQPARV